MSVDENGEKTSAMTVSRACRDLIAYLPRLMRDEKDPNDCKTKPHEITHITDALRYFATYHTAIPAKKSEPVRQKLTRSLKNYRRII